MEFDKSKIEQTYLKIVKWFGIIVFLINYAVFTISLIIERNIIVFIAGIVVTTPLAVVWIRYYKFKSKNVQ